MHRRDLVKNFGTVAVFLNDTLNANHLHPNTTEALAVGNLDRGSTAMALFTFAETASPRSRKGGLSSEWGGSAAAIDFIYILCPSTFR